MAAPPREGIFKLLTSKTPPPRLIIMPLVHKTSDVAKLTLTLELSKLLSLQLVSLVLVCLFAGCEAKYTVMLLAAVNK